MLPLSSYNSPPRYDATLTTVTKSVNNDKTSKHLCYQDGKLNCKNTKSNFTLPTTELRGSQYYNSWNSIYPSPLVYLNLGSRLIKDFFRDPSFKLFTFQFLLGNSIAFPDQKRYINSSAGRGFTLGFLHIWACF